MKLIMQTSMLNMSVSSRMMLELFFLYFLGENVSKVLKWVLDLFIDKKE